MSGVSIDILSEKIVIKIKNEAFLEYMLWVHKLSLIIYTLQEQIKKTFFFSSRIIF